MSLNQMIKNIRDKINSTEWKAMSVVASLLLLFSLTMVNIGYWRLYGILSGVLILIILFIFLFTEFFKSENKGEIVFFYIFNTVIFVWYFAILYKGGNVVDSSCPPVPIDNIFDAIYFSIVTWTTLGYGDFRPNSEFAKLIVMIESIIGYLFMGVLVGMLISFVGDRKEK